MDLKFYTVVVSSIQGESGTTLHLEYMRLLTQGNKTINIYGTTPVNPEISEQLSKRYGVPLVFLDGESQLVVFGFETQSEVAQEQKHLSRVLDMLQAAKQTKEQEVEVELDNYRALVHPTTRRRLLQDSEFADTYRQFEAAIRTHVLSETLQLPEGQTGTSLERR